MALNDMGGYSMTMPVAPLYGGGYPLGAGYGGGLSGFGGDGWWIILLLLLGGGMWGGFGMGGWGGMMGAGMMGMDWLYPWLSNSRQISDGFQTQQMANQVSDLRSDVNRGFGDVQLGIAGLGRQVCETGNNITGAVRDGFSAAEIAANGRQMANMQQGFGMQTAMQQGFFGLQTQAADCCCKTQTGIADLKYTIARENCDDRAALAQGLQQQTMQEMTNTNALMTAIRDGIQSLKDEFSADRLDAERRENQNLRSENQYLRNQADRLAQADAIIDRTYARFKDCPVGTVPVFGNTPIWTCTRNVAGGNGGCPGNGVALSAS